MSTQSSCHYYSTFIDNNSHYISVYLLKPKFKDFDKFGQYKNLIENQTNKKIKVLKWDNGGEFKSNTFNLYCKEQGIQRHFIITYTHQLNNVYNCKILH